MAGGGSEVSGRNRLESSDLAFVVELIIQSALDSGIHDRSGKQMRRAEDGGQRIEGGGGEEGAAEET